MAWHTWGTDLLLVGERRAVARGMHLEGSRIWQCFTSNSFLEIMRYHRRVTRDANTGPAERHRLDDALHRASVDAEDLDAARRVLLDRLSRRSDDFAATTALQALTTYSAGQRFDAQSDDSARLQRAELPRLRRRKASAR
jgi:hypothetical protein